MSHTSEKLADIGKRRESVTAERKEITRQREALTAGVESGNVELGTATVELERLQQWVVRLGKTLKQLQAELAALRSGASGEQSPSRGTATETAVETRPIEPIVIEKEVPVTRPEPPTGGAAAETGPALTTPTDQPAVVARPGTTRFRRPVQTAEEKRLAEEAKRVAELQRVREQCEGIVNGAQGYEAGKRLPTGAWRPGPGGAEVSGSGKTAILGKKTIGMTAEQAEATNAKLVENGSLFRFSPASGAGMTIGDKTLLPLKPTLTFPEGAVDATLRGRRERSEDVTYADCHRNAVVSLGFGYDPASSADCEKPVIDPAVLPDGPKRADKINAFKQYCKAPEKEVHGNLGARLIEHSSFIGNVAERGARGAIGGYFDKVAASDEDLGRSFAALDSAINPGFQKGISELAKTTPPTREEQEQLVRDQETLKGAKQVWNKYNMLSEINDAWKATEGQSEDKRTRIVKEKIGALYELVDRNNERQKNFVDSFPVAKALKCFDDMCHDLKINQYCEPKPGQAMTMLTAGGSDLWEKPETEQRKQELAGRQRKYVAAMAGIAAEEVTADHIMAHSGTEFPETLEACSPAQRAHVADRAGVPVEALTPELFAKNREEGFPSEMETWNFHWAAAVATDGGDYMTFENFSVENPDAINGKQIVNAYGPDRTFYDHYKSSGFFGTGAVAMCFEAKRDDQ